MTSLLTFHQRHHSIMTCDRPKRKRSRISYQEPESSDSENFGNPIVPFDDEEFDPNPKPPKLARTTPKRQPKKSSVFPFFNLPRELRDQIYEFTLVGSSGIVLKASKSIHRRVPQRIRYHYSPYSRVQPEGLAPNLLRTCRAVYEEALPILYGQPISFLDTRALYNFLSVAGPTNIALLKHLLIEELPYSKTCKAIARPAFALLGPASRLRKLTMDFYYAWIPESDFNKECAEVAKRLFSICFEFLEIRVREDIKDGQMEERDAISVFDLEYHPYGNRPGIREEFRKEILKLIQRNIDSRYK
jgi:hypothetical protein